MRQIGVACSEARRQAHACLNAAKALIAVLAIGSCLLVPAVARAQVTLIMVTLKPEADTLAFEKALTSLDGG